MKKLLESQCPEEQRRRQALKIQSHLKITFCGRVQSQLAINLLKK
jgi:hypothetical protein